MLPFKTYGRIDRSEGKALLIAGVCCFLFIVFLSGVYRLPAAAKRRKVVTNITIPTPLPPTKLLEPELPPVSPLQQYRIIPENFRHVDFANHSYGLYATPDSANAKVIGLTLRDGELQLPKNSGWFELKDVFYKDFTRDGKPEAVVRLSHVECGGSCDGGSDLFYIYTQVNGQLITLWQYETGTYAYGCGLKSFTISNRQLVLELFGRCPEQRAENPGASKFLTKNSTFVLFEFDGQRFERKMTEFFDSSIVDVKNYEAPIYIY